MRNFMHRAWLAITTGFANLCRCRSWLTPEHLDLLTLAGVCVINGRLVTYLSGDVWRIEEICELGLLGFSGPGSLTVAMQFRGTFYRRLIQVAGVYLVIGIGAVAMTVMYPVFEGVLPVNARLFIGLHLLGLALRLSDVPSLRRVASWEGFDATMKVLLALILIQVSLRGITGSLPWHLSFDRIVLGALAVALSTGLGLTTIGVLLGKVFAATVSLQPLKCGAAGTLLTSALFNYLGVPIPSILPLPPIVLMLSPLAVGLLWTVIVAGYMILTPNQRGTRETRGPSTQQP